MIEALDRVEAKIIDLPEPPVIQTTDRDDGILNVEDVNEGGRVVRAVLPPADPALVGTEYHGPPISVGLSVETFRDLCVKAGKSTVAIAKAIETTPDKVGGRVKAMSPVERGVLADELGIEWRQ
jgi:hypothetical protein